MSQDSFKQEGRILRLDRISQSRLQGLDRERTMVIAALSPVEVHGPHLPLGQDMMEACAITETILERVSRRRREWTFLLLPPVPVAADALPQLGSITFPVSVVRDVAYHLLRPFARFGFSRLAFTTFHGGPRHNCALESAAEKLSRKYDTAVLPFFSAVLSRVMQGSVFFDGIEHTPERRITPDQLRQDYHAGFVETSLGLHLWPELVEDGWQNIPGLVNADGTDTTGQDHYLYADDPSGSSLKRLRRVMERVRAMAGSATHFRSHTYRGYPALSSAEEGRDLFEHLAGIGEGVVEEFLDRGKEMDGHSPLWKFRRILLSPAANKVYDTLLGDYTE